jgi:hypothetical protein
MALFLNHINFCHGYVYPDRWDEEGNQIEKPENRVYSWFYRNWLWPFKQNDCMCCNTVRGLMYGLVIGYLIGSYL